MKGNGDNREPHNKPNTEEEATQQIREMLKRETSPEFQNFADGMNRALSTPKRRKETVKQS